MAQEYRDAALVLRARLVSQIDTWDDYPPPEYKARWGDGGLVTLYGLKVLQTYKGAPAGRVHVYMPHDSGAFYIDADKDYLLFLNRIPPAQGLPGAAKRAFSVNYACGQSKPWAAVKPEALERLRSISGR